jgi:hypothetical protein
VNTHGEIESAISEGMSPVGLTAAFAQGPPKQV